MAEESPVPVPNLELSAEMESLSVIDQEAASSDSKPSTTELILEERFQLIRSVGAECIQEEELRNLLAKKKDIVCYDGFEPSGRMHIAQGVMKAINVNKLTAAGCKMKFWIADWFAQLNNKMGGDLKKIQTTGHYLIEIWKAVGMDLDRVEFLWSSEEINARAHEYWPLVMDIARRNSLHRIVRCCQIMGRKEQDDLTAAQIFYPCMQCADIFFLKADICQLGMDQRKVNVLAREYCDDIKRKNKPIILSHHMLPGLLEGQEKMSKSDPSSSIFMEDEEAEVNVKIKKAYCPPKIVEGNPCLEYIKYIVFPWFGKFEVERDAKNGGNKTYHSNEELIADYQSGDLHPGDVKPALSKALNNILQPVRDHFNAPLDYAAFRISRECASYEAFVSGQGKTEKLGSGLLEHLLVHLPAAKDHPSGPGGLLKLELPEGLRGASWFSKHIFERFLHIVGAPELLKAANTIENEMSQLEEARMFHLNLYAKGDRVNSGNGAKDLTYMESTEPPLEHKVQTTLSDATKNELLRAMDLRLTASRGELVNAFNRVTGATCSTKQIANLAAFVQHFGAADLRSSLLKYLALVQNNQPDDKAREPSAFSHNTKSGPGKITEEMALAALPVLPTSVSPAKIAQAERHSSTDSDNSSNSSNEGESPGERSRPVIRSATPRRSASPMRRIQIGRSGSRRSPALTIKSLSYIPARDKVSSYRDDAGNSSDDAEHVQLPKKPESLVRRMSVQDAINLFESKQRDQRLDLQKQRSSAEISTNTKKSVLRRWSAGTSDCSSTQCPPENSSYSDFPVAAENSELKPGQENQSEVKLESDSPSENPLAAKTSEKDSSFIEQNVAASPTNGPEDSVPSKAEEIHDRLTASAEWNRQKEAELNQMLMKMMENKPVRNRNTVNANGRNQEHSGERRGGFYDHYREKRDEKLRGENAGKRAEKEAQFKAMQDVLDQRKAEMARKNTVATGKQESPVRSQKLMRNSSPTLTKREGPKPSPKSTGSRKVLPKTSPLPATRNSWPSAASPRTSGLGTAKISGGISNAGTTPNRRKPQPVPSPTRSSTKTEKPHQQQKGIKGESTDSNRSLKAKVEKKEQVVKKSSKIVKTLATSGDDSGTVPAKPSFYSKVTKKGSVVPLESKPFLRKGTGIGPGVGPVIVKTKASQSDDTSKNNSIVIQVQEGAISGTEMLVQQPEGDVAQSEMGSIDPETPVKSIQNCEIMEIPEKFTSEAINCVTKEDEFPVETPASEKSTISASAWVEIEETQEFPVSHENGPLEMTIPEAIVAPAALASPRVRHSLSQMLQADSGESEIIEWGNAENPPAMVYQKDAPKGLKRLLKFARKSRGEAMLTDSTSMLVFSEGEEDGDEPKAVGKRNVEALLRKGGLQEKGFLQHKAMFGGSYDGEHSSKKTLEYAAVHEFLPGQSSLGSFAAQSSSHKSREGQMSTTATSTKGSRSFFSLSTFRKSSDTKLR